jgi:DNA-binding SARP family transcriptional activator
MSDSDFDFQRGEWAYVASVPAGSAEVGLELSAGGYAQTFSLLRRERTGAQPTVLYRDPLLPDIVRENAGERTLRVVDVQTGDKGSLTFTLKQGRLSFFTPPEQVGPADDPSQAFLAVEADVDSPYIRGEAQFNHYKALPASALTATLPDSTVVQAQHSGPDDDGFMSGSYYFPVPGDVEAVRVAIRPGTFDAYRDGESGSLPTPVRAEGAALFDIELTPGGAAKLPKLAKGTTATTARQGDDEREAAGLPTEPASDGGRGGGPWVPLLVVLGVTAAAIGLVLRKRTAVKAGPPGAHPEAPAPTASLTLPVPFATLAGAGAADAARAAIVEAMADDRAGVVVLDAGPVEEVLDGLDVEGVRMVGSAGALGQEVDAACLAASRAAHEGNGSGPSPRPLVLVVVPGGAADIAPDEHLRAGVDLRVLALGGAAEPVVTIDEHGAATLADGARGRVPLVAAQQAVLDAKEDWDSGDGEADPAPIVAVPEEATAENTHEAGSASPSTNGGATFVELLGPCRIAVGGEQIRTGLRHKARELLVLLAVRPDGVTQDAAIEALWPDAEREKASEYLRQAVKNLRRVFRPLEGPDGGVIDRDGPRYRLTDRLRHVDVREFEAAVRAAESGDAEAAQRAIDLYRGDLAEGYDYAWIEPDREHLRLLLFNAISRRVEACRAAGDLEGAAAALSRGIAVDRFSEPLYRDLMAVQRAQGREDAVRRTYTRVEGALAEIGMKPEPRTTALLDGGTPGPS